MNMTKTPVTYKETLLGVLEMREIEKIIMDNLIQVQKYIFRNFQNLPIDQSTVKLIHKLLAGNLFTEAGTYRKHNIQLGLYGPPQFFDISKYMKDWEDDYTERLRYAQKKEEKIELCAWLIHRFLWVHPFFDYNGRISRILGELFLLQNHLPVVSFQKTARFDFVKAVQYATKENDLSLLIKLVQKKI